MKSLYTLIILLISLTGCAQCNELITITKREFDQYYIKGDTAKYSPDFVKQRTGFKIPGGDVIYTDYFNPSEDGVLSYWPRGVIFKNIYVLETQDETMNYYNLIRTEPYMDHGIIGFPYIFGNYMLAIEEPHTDYPLTIQAWKIKNKGKNTDFQLKKEISLSKCGTYNIDAAYIHNGFIYLKNNASVVSYFKIKI
jgi:hypothetical protein